MKRMVKNGDLLDVEPDGTITVGGKPIGGGSDDRVLKLIAPYSYNGGNLISDIKIYVEEDIWNKIKTLYYDTIKVYYKDGKPIGVFHVLNLNSNNYIDSNRYACVSKYQGSFYTDDWFGRNDWSYWIAVITIDSDSTGKYITFFGDQPHSIPYLQKSKFDALYKLADKPTGDGTYVLKATVSGGAVTYTWVAQ